MGRQWENWFPLPDGKTTVGYALVERGDIYRVRFANPDGKRVEVTTGCRKKADAFVEAAKIVLKAYSGTVVDLKGLTWDEALDEVTKSARDLRPATLSGYAKAIKSLRETLGVALPPTPSKFTREHASRYGRLFLSTGYRRSKHAGAATYKRSPVTLSFYLRALSALWGQFEELGLVRDNPWTTVRRPQLEKKRKEVPTEDQVNHFFAWVRTRYPDWEGLHALLELKALSGCRTLDLCQLRTNQLRGGRMVWEASQTKTREGKSVLLPSDLYERLRRIAGKTHLWEQFVDDLKRFRPSKNRPPEAFTPQTVYHVLNNLFREYAELHPDRPRLTPHALRRRAITLTVMATQNVDLTAQAIGVHPQTARSYYLDGQRALNVDDVFRKVADLLRPGEAQG